MIYKHIQKRLICNNSSQENRYGMFKLKVFAKSK